MLSDESPTLAIKPIAPYRVDRAYTNDRATNTLERDNIAFLDLSEGRHLLLRKA